MYIDGVKVKKITILQGGTNKCKKAFLTSGEKVFSSDFKVTVNCYEIKINDRYEREYKLRTVIEAFDSDEPIHVKIISYGFYQDDREVVQFDGDVTSSGKVIEWHNEWGGAGGNFNYSNVKSIQISHGNYSETVTIPYRNPFDVSATSSWRNYYSKTFTVTN